MTYISFNPSSVFRGVNQAKWTKETGEDTALTKASTKKAANQTDKAPVTVAFEDFSKIAIGRDDRGRQSLGPKAAKGDFFENLFGVQKDNIFRNGDLKQGIVGTKTESGRYYIQNDLFNEHIEKDGGLVYNKEGDNLENSALNYAKADIYAIEHSLYTSTPESNVKIDGKLNVADITSYSSLEKYDAEKAIELFDIDGDGKISAEEYASFTIVADGIKKDVTGQDWRKNDIYEYSFDIKNCDGKVAQDEAKTFDDAPPDMLVKWATSVFNSKYKK